MADVYEQRSYAQVPIGFGHRPGIVVVDYQVGFTDPQYALGGAPLVARGVENTQRLLDKARRGDKVMTEWRLRIPSLEKYE